MSVSIAVVCEAPADRDTITTLADRVILETAAETAPWIDGFESLGYTRTWRGFRATDPHLEWTALKRHATDLDLVVRFRNEPPQNPYSLNALRSVLVLANSPDPVDAIILIADSDGDKDRLKGLEQARRYVGSAIPIAVGLMHTKRECWHLAGFQPEPGEQTVVAGLRQQLGHDPWLRTEELTAKHDHDKRSAKRVLSELCRNDRDRETRCLTSTPIDVLCERGQGNGLAAFVAELRTHIVPLVLGVRHRPPGR